MPGMIDRIEEIAKTDRSMLPTHAERFESKNSAVIVGTHRFLSVADYLETGDPKVFQKHMLTAIKYQIQLFERAEAGGKVSWSFLDAKSFPEVWNALASSSFNVTRTLVEHMYKLNPDLKNYADVTMPYKTADFERYFNLMFRALILNMPFEDKILQQMYEIFQKKYKSYQGYPLAFEAIYRKDCDAFQEAFKIVMKGHKVLCRRGAEFGDSADEIIAIWPLGLINLARMKGMDVSVNDPMIPIELLAPISSFA